MSHTEPHDEFLELCAVATSGQLTSEEQQKLREHLAACSSCREAIRQYEAVVGHALAAMAAREVPEHVHPRPGWSMDKIDEAEAELFERIAREDEASWPPQKKQKHRAETERSTDTRRVLPFSGEATWRRVWTLYAAGILLSIALGICAYQVGIRRGVSTATVAPLQPSPQLTPRLGRTVERRRP